VADRVTFDVHTAKTYPGGNYDLVCFFDCLHDMGDPVGAIKHVRETMAGDGTCMLVEPFANDRLEDNLNPVGRVYYAASTMICTPASLDQEVGLALGAQAGEARLRDVARQGGLNRFRRAAETPFNLIPEARAGSEKDGGKGRMERDGQSSRSSLFAETYNHRNEKRRVGKGASRRAHQFQTEP